MNYSSEFLGQFRLFDCLEAAGTVIEEIVIIGCVFNYLPPRYHNCLYFFVFTL